VDCLTALASFSSPELVQQTLALTLGDAVTAQDIGLVLSSLLLQPASRPLAWEFLRSHPERLLPRLPPLILNRLVLPAVGALCGPHDHAEVAALFERHPVPGIERPLARALDAIDGCARARPRLERELRAWLRGQR
jgi:hypothetical protein